MVRMTNLDHSLIVNSCYLEKNNVVQLMPLHRVVHSSMMHAENIPMKNSLMN